MKLNTMHSVAVRSAGAFFLFLGAAAAQGGNPMEEIKEIFRRVEKEMSEIDALLLNAATAKAATKMSEATEDLQKLLDQAKGKQTSVIKGIQEILDKAPQSGKGGGGGKDPKQKKPDQKPQDHERDPSEGEKKEQEPRNPHGNPPPTGENQPAMRPPPESPTGQTDRSEVDRQWGNLPDYLRAIHSQKGAPPVPAKYRRFFEEFMRQSAKARN